jgi:hypothetical protein
MIEIESLVNHQLGRLTAIKRMQEFVGSLPQRFPQQVHQVSMQVHDDSVQVRFAAYGYRLLWIADVKESCVVLHGQLPDSADKVKDKMARTVVDRITEALRTTTNTLRRAA